MYCGKCGAENPDENKFCEKCGEELVKPREPKQDVKPEKGSASDEKAGASPAGKHKKLLLGGIAAFTVIILCIIGVTVNMDSKASAEYNAKVEEADRYMEQMEYEKAETAYLEAIDIEPKVDEAYLKLADTYVVQEKYEEAVEILEKGEENAGGQEIIAKLEKVTPYSNYYDYLKENVIPQVGLAAVDETYYWGENGGLVSALIKDINGDEIPEMITITYGDTQHSIITISCYTCEDGEVALASEYVEDELDDGYKIGNRYEIFLKEHERQYYLVIAGYKIPDLEGKTDYMRIYHMDKEKIEIACDVTAFGIWGWDSYYVNGTLVSKAEIDDSEEYYGEEELRAAEKVGLPAFEEALESYGLSEKVTYTETGWRTIAGCDDSEQTETAISYIECGEFSEEGTVNFQMTDLRFLRDYTELRNKLEQ